VINVAGETNGSKNSDPVMLRDRMFAGNVVPDRGAFGGGGDPKEGEESPRVNFSGGGRAQRGVLQGLLLKLIGTVKTRNWGERRGKKRRCRGKPLHVTKRGAAVPLIDAIN